MCRSLSAALAATMALTSLTGCLIDLDFPSLHGDMPLDAHPALEMKALPESYGGNVQKPIPAGLGVNIHFYEGNEKDWKMLAEAGVGIVRMDVSWAGCEKKRGEYDFSRHDALVSKLEKRNIRLLFIIDYGNPLYDSGLAPHSEECRAAYAQFVSALVKRYAGKQIIWELWNEPDISFWKPKPNVEDYMAWCKAVVPSIRQADPKACIVAPATSCIPLGFLEECFRRGLLELVDGVSVHPYRGAKSGPETAIREYKRLDRLIRRYTPEAEEGKRRKLIPILSGEWGYSTTYVSREQQGKYLPRQWLANTASGLPISIWYDWHDDGKDPKEKEHNFGTVTWDYKPKSAYVAMKTLIEQLRGYQIADRIDMGDEDDFVVVARKGGQVKLAVWTTGDPHEIELGPDIRIAGAVDHLGNKIDVPDGPRQPVTDSPRYLTVASPAPSWFHTLPLHVGVTSLPKLDDLDFMVVAELFNLTDKPAEATLNPVRTKETHLAGSWLPVGTVLGPGCGMPGAFMGRVYRRDRTAIPVTVSAHVAFEGETPHTITKTVEFDVPHPVSLDVCWRQDGLRATIGRSGDRPLRGRVIPKVDGVDRRAIGIALDEDETRAVVQWDDIRLAGVPRHVGVRLEDQMGHLIAEVDPMTYALVDGVDAPIGGDAGQHYRLWHEGDPKRKAKLSGAIVRAPGDDPPFPKAVRVDYDMAAGWCFWQLGPKDTPQMYPDEPKRIMLWVHGQDAHDAVRCRVLDATGQTLQPTAGTLDFNGWRMMTMSLEGRMGSWGGAADGKAHPPLKWMSYYLQDSTRSAHTGTTYLTGVVVAW